MNGGVASGGGSQSYDNDGTFTIGSPHRLHRRALRHRDLDADARGRHAQRRRLLGLRRPEHARRHPGAERARDRLLPLHPHRHRSGRQRRLDRHCRQGRHERARRARPGARRLERRRPHHRHHRLLPARRQRLLRRHRQLERCAVRDPRLPLPRRSPASRLRLRRDAHVHARDADGAERRQDGQRAQQRPADRGLELHAHLRRDRADRWRPDRQRRGGQRRRPQSYDGDGSFPIDARTNYNADALSGFATSVLTREDGTLAGDACSSYGAPATLVGTPAQSGLATGCYRYVLTGTDNVGNTIDDHHRRQGRHERACRARRCSLNDSSAEVHTTGTTAFYRPPAAAPSTSPPAPPTAQSGILTTPSPRSPASPAPAPAHPHLHARDADRAGRRASRSPPATRRCRSNATTSRSPPTRPTRPAARSTVNGDRREPRRHQSYDDDGASRSASAPTTRRRRLRHQHLDPDARARHAQRRRLLGLRRPHHPRRHPRPERPRHRLLPLHAHRHRQRRQLRLASRRSSRSTSPIRPPRACRSPNRAPTSTPPARPPSTAPPAPAPSTSPPARPTASPASPATPSPPSPASPLRHGRRRGPTRSTRPTEPDGAKTVTAHQQRRPHQQLHLHAHRRLDGPGRRLDHGERRRRLRHRRHRRAREDRLRRRRLRHRLADVSRAPRRRSSTTRAAASPAPTRSRSSPATTPTPWAPAATATRSPPRTTSATRTARRARS